MTFKEKYTNVLKAAQLLRSQGDFEKAEWIIEQCRGDEISARISKVYPLSAQIALLMDKDLKYDEWVEYQAFRANIKADVNQEAEKIEYELSHGA